MGFRQRASLPEAVALTTALAVASGGIAMAARASDDDPAKRPQQVAAPCVVAELAAGGYCGDRGPAELAGLAAPRDVAFFPNGDLLVADGQNSAIRRVSRATGVISTVAGLGVFGDTPPAKPTPVAEVALADPRGVAALPDGSFVIADAGLRAVLLVTPDGLVRTLLDRHDLKLPTDVAVLDDDSLVVADTAAGSVIKVDLNGRKRRLAGRLDRPWQVAVEPAGSLVVSQIRPTKRTRTKSGKRRTIRNRGNVVRIPSGGGKPSVIAGPGAAGPAGGLRFERLSGVAAMHDGSILVADGRFAGRASLTPAVVQAISPAGASTPVVGGADFASDMYVGLPEGIAYANGVLAVADSGRNQAFRVPLDPAGPVTAIGIDVANPPRASTRSISSRRASTVQAARGAKQKRHSQPPGHATCAKKAGMSPTWAPKFDGATIVVAFNDKGTIRIGAAKGRTGRDVEVDTRTFRTPPRHPQRLKAKFKRSHKIVPHGYFIRLTWLGGCLQTKMP